MVNMKKVIRYLTNNFKNIWKNNTKESTAFTKQSIHR